MMSFVRNAAFSWLLLVPITNVGVGAAADRVELPDEIRQALADNARRMDPVTVQWEMDRRTPLPAGQLLPKLGFPASPQEFSLNRSVRYAWHNGMAWSFQRDRWQQAADVDTAARPPLYGIDPPDEKDPQVRRIPPRLKEPRKLVKIEREHEVSVDRENWYNATGSEKSMGVIGTGRMIMITPLDQARQEHPEAVLILTDYLHEAGFKFPRTALEQGELQQSLPLYLIEQGGRVEDVRQKSADGAPCTVVDIHTGADRVRFQLDPARQYAVLVREVYTPSGQLLTRCSNSDFMRISDLDLWLPKVCSVAHYRWAEAPQQEPSTQPVAYETYRLIEAKIEPIPDARFDLKSKYNEPGTFVADRSLPEAADLPLGQVQFRIPADPSRLEKVIEDAKKGRVDFGTGIPPRGGRFEMIRWGMTLASVMALVLFLAWRYHRAENRRS